MEERIRKIFSDLDNFISYNCTKKYKKRPTAICEDCNMNCLASYVIHREEEVRKETAKRFLKMLYDMGVDRQTVETCGIYDVNGSALARFVSQEFGVEVEE